MCYIFRTGLNGIGMSVVLYSIQHILNITMGVHFLSNFNVHNLEILDNISGRIYWVLITGPQLLKSAYPLNY